MIGLGMFSKKLIAVMVFLSCLPLIAFAIVWQFESVILHPSLSHSGWEEGGGQTTLGKRRHALLDELTRTYLASNPNGSVWKVNGRRLAPPVYLNRQLEKRSESWRVDIVDGKLDFVEVT
ncbi:MAG: hypothetical protein R3E09_03990 [Novosphingobium sp.]|nr:hypothetical protein [Novosphingobium sp.]